MNLFFELIRVALGTQERLSREPSAEEWLELYRWCQQQAVVGIAFCALDRLCEAGQHPPQAVVYHWFAQSEQISRRNRLMNSEAARYTALFEKAGHQTVILKGQANARMYPNPLTRQPGDIDIYLDGGREKVIGTLKSIGLADRISRYENAGETSITYHHVHLPQNAEGVDVEVHFRPSSGSYSPICNRRIQKYLTAEALKGRTRVAEGFYVPNFRFASIMQMAHIQRHALGEGVGLRQIMDYYFLLKTQNDGSWKQEDIRATLRSLGLWKMAGAVMWILNERLGLEEQFLIAPKHEKRGLLLLQIIMDGGNFGHFKKKEEGAVARNLWSAVWHLKNISLCPNEIIWYGLDYLVFFTKSIPERLKRGKLSLGHKHLFLTRMER